MNLPLRNALNFIGDGVQAVDNPGAGATDVTINDLYAATRIVSTDPTQGTDLTIQDAVDNLPAEGGTIFIKDLPITQGPVLLSDKDITIQVSPSTDLNMGSSAISLFKTPALCAVPRKYRFVGYGVRILGDSAAAQIAFENADASGYAEFDIEGFRFEGVKTPFFASAGDLTYKQGTRWFIRNCELPPLTVGCKLFDSAFVAGTYKWPMMAFMYSCWAVDTADNSLGWEINFDGDLILRDSILWLKGGTSNGVNGLEISGDAVIQAGPSTVSVALHAFGDSWYGLGKSLGASLWSIELTVDLFWNAADLWLGDKAKLIINCNFGFTLTGIRTLINTSAIGIDVLSTSGQGSITGGNMSGCTVAAIRTALASGIAINGIAFAMGGGANTVKEVAPGNKTAISGCTGVGTGGGLALVGAASIAYQVVPKNIP